LLKVRDGLVAVLVDRMGGFDATLAEKPLPFTERPPRPDPQGDFRC